MKVSIDWLKELVDLKIPIEEVVRLLPFRTIGLREVTADFIELDMKGYNRADLLSMRGVAYEVAAITNSNVTFAEIEPADFVWEERNLPAAVAKVENHKLAPIYCVAKIENLTAAPSPKEWVKKLTDCGIRSVNNVVDVTNLAMLEYGQDMHAFDADKVAAQTLIVRLAKKGEELITLDDKKRTLSQKDLIISDGEKVIGLAGVMGGKDTEISEQTTNILLEVTIFDPVTIRQTSQRHGLYSEASRRVQHGLTIKRLLQSFNATIVTYQQIGGKLTAIKLLGDFNQQKKVISLTLKKIQSVVGVAISPKQVEEDLAKLHFKLDLVKTGEWSVTVPYWRLDIELEEDLIEEVARMYGYEKIPVKALAGKIPQQAANPIFDLIDKTTLALVNLGLTEVQTYSFYSTEVQNALGFGNKSKSSLIKIANPISAETEYLRQDLWPNLAEVAAKNIRRGQKDIAIFEIGRVYYYDKNGQVQETDRLAIALSNNTTNPIEELITLIAKSKIPITQGSNQLSGNDEASFHPTRHLSVKISSNHIGQISEIHPRVMNRLGTDSRVAVLEFELEPLLFKNP